MPTLQILTTLLFALCGKKLLLFVSLHLCCRYNRLKVCYNGFCWIFDNGPSVNIFEEEKPTYKRHSLICKIPESCLAACIEDPVVIKKILAHLKKQMPATIKYVTPEGRSPPQNNLFTI